MYDFVARIEKQKNMLCFILLSSNLDLNGLLNNELQNVE